jgi:hypothetical protein
MLDDQLIEKLQEWVEAHPESADTPFMNVSTGQEFTVTGLLSKLQASVAGEVQLSDSLQSEIDQIKDWIGGF